MTPDPNNPVYIPYWHRLGSRACQFVAIYVFDGVSDADAIRGVGIRRADGGLVRWEDGYHCTSCGALLPLPMPMPEGADEVDV